MSTSPAFNSIIAEINAAGTDRGVAVLAGSFIEGLLAKLLSRVLVPGKATKNYLENAPVSAQQNLAYMTGLIPKSLLDDLRKISGIRNDFAHNIDVQTFEWGNHKELIRDMHAARGNFAYSGPPPTGVEGPITNIGQLPLRIQFLFKVAFVGGMLEQIAESAPPFVESRFIYPPTAA